MNRIDRAFKALRERDRAAFIPYITAGDPDMATTQRLILALERAGADIIELGVPFSDPLADGPVIQAASQRALAKQANLERIFAMVELVRIKTEIPLVFMTYFNPVLQYGIDRFFATCAEVGVDGVIIPDLPYDEAAEVIEAGRRAEVATIFLATPTSPAKRLREIARHSTGFIYYVSLTGVTGTRQGLPRELAASVKRFKAMTDKPVAVGFGIADGVSARRVAQVADGVIVGSALVRIIAGAAGAADAPRQAELFAADLAKAIHGE